MLPARHGAGISPGMNSSDQAYHPLRAKILEGLFKPGSLPKERELCEQPSVSRTPIREALRRLSADGWSKSDRAGRSSSVHSTRTIWRKSSSWESCWKVSLRGLRRVVPVDGRGQALDNPWLEIIAMRDRVAHPDRADLAVLANPLKLDGRRLPDRAAPLLGADSGAILGEFGYVADEIAALRSSGLV